MGNTKSTNKLNYEDLNILIKRNDCIIINTMPVDMQSCLIVNTVSVVEEEHLINESLNNDKQKTIIVYGKNCTDETIYNKYDQLIGLGFTNVNLYMGGMFEWMLLQDIYGDEEFATTSKELDILKFKSESKMSRLYLTN